jgi:predicted anti-sigma-YlaC factor YlaD
MRRVDQHVARCEACRQASDELAALGGALRALPTPQPPAELVAHVQRLAEARLALQHAPHNGATFLAPLDVASWIAALVTWPLVRAAFQWIVTGWHVPSGGLGSTLAVYSILGFILACASALAVGRGARQIGRTK